MIYTGHFFKLLPAKAKLCASVVYSAAYCHLSVSIHKFVINLHCTFEEVFDKTTKKRYIIPL